LERIVSLAGALLRRPAVAMAAMPMLIGLIPMPGGAIFSASMVQDAAGKTQLTGGRLSAINYWFRHVWEYWWPLYPAVLVATQQLRLDFGVFAALMSPLTVFMLVSGLLIFRRTHPDLHVAGAAAPEGTKRRLLWATSSIWIIVLAWVAAEFVVRAILGEPPAKGAAESASTIRKFLPVSMSLLVSLAWTAGINKLTLAAYKKILLGRSLYGMVILAVAVMVFQFSLGHVKAADRIAADLKELRVPILLVLVILPFIAGLVTGLGVGFVGSSFPIVVPLAATLSGSILPYIMIAFASGHMGMMYSPVHLCQVVSNRYFKTGFGPVYRQMLLPSLATATLIAGYFLLLRTVLK
jgi:hypothetical protein